MRSRSRGGRRRPQHARRTRRHGGRVALLGALLVCSLGVAAFLLQGGTGNSVPADVAVGWMAAAGSPPDNRHEEAPAGRVARAGRVQRPASGAGPATRGVPVGPWAVVGLGDSVTSGANCACTPFVQRYADLTGQLLGRPVRAQDLGVPGLTSEGLLDQLQDGSDTGQSVAGADIVVVTIGANDAAASLQSWSDGTCGQACFDARAARIRGNVQQILERILQLRAGRPTQILVTTYWNVVEDGAVARQEYSDGYLQVSDALTRQVNGALCDAVKAATDGQTSPSGELVCVDLYAPFKGGGDQDPTALLSSDGDHPDAAGHELIAHTLLSVGWSALGVPA
ncbi:MAG TPA: SGNH/GDSL hydrolase family protein [Kineosporiaceae bacterium]|nr:SGNH/GDSL hydrolase family protein [Kineosporiaceae bacterium]